MCLHVMIWELTGGPPKKPGELLCNYYTKGRMEGDWKGRKPLPGTGECKLLPLVWLCGLKGPLAPGDTRVACESAVCANLLSTGLTTDISSRASHEHI